MLHPRSRVSRTGLRSSPHSVLIPVVFFLLAACSAPLAGVDPGAAITGYSAADATVASSAFAVVPDSASASGVVLATGTNIAAADVGLEQAHVDVALPVAGERALWARIRGETDDNDAIYVGFDGAMERIYPDAHGAYEWVYVTTADLDAGSHHISIGLGEPNVRLDMLVVARDTNLDADDLEAWRRGKPVKPRPEPTPPRDGVSLRGNPAFRVSEMSTDAQLWYRRMWSAIESPGDGTDPDAWAASDDLYTYARQLHTHVQTLLTAFRITGDLRLLDEVDRLAEIMRTRLADGWRGTLDGTDGTRDGYRNWVWRGGDEAEFRGKDTIKIDEMKTHSMIAMIAYALEVNRDLASPSGRSYGAHADYWLDYLENDFEAKWRERENVPTGFPIMIRPHTHTYYSWMKWHYYMGLLTGDGGYSAEADRMADVIWDEEIREVSTPSGTAYVWYRSVVSEGGHEEYLHPTTYARYVFADAVDFYLEGYHRWADPETLRRLARTFTEFVIDTEGADGSKDWFASDIGGGVSRVGIPSDPTWSRMDVYKFEASPYALIMPWDASGDLGDITMSVLDLVGSPESPRTIYLAAGFFLEAALNPDTSPAYAVR